MHDVLHDHAAKAYLDQGVPNKGSRLGIYKRLIKKLELVGCIRRVKANADEAAGGRLYSCLKYIREPTKDEWRLPWNLSVPVGVSLANEISPEFDAEGENDEDEEQGASLQPANPVNGEAASIQENDGKLQEVGRILPQWRPSKPMGNLLRDIIEKAGTEGISTMVSRSCLEISATLAMLIV